MLLKKLKQGKWNREIREELFYRVVRNKLYDKAIPTDLNKSQI